MSTTKLTIQCKYISIPNITDYMKSFEGEKCEVPGLYKNYEKF